MITIEPVIRKFTYADTDLPDPNPNLSSGQVPSQDFQPYPFG